MTPADPTSSRLQQLLLITGIVLIGLNLRPAITALSPLAERMHADGLSRAHIGSLTTIPLLLFSLVGFWAGWTGQRLGFARALGLGLAVLAIGCLLRSAGGEAGLLWQFTGTILIGAGIALGNVLLPGLAKSRYPAHLGPITSLYVTAMNLGAAAGIAFSVPLAIHLNGGWNASLATWAWLALGVLLLWFPQMRPRPTVRRPAHPLHGILKLSKHPRAWHITAYMGLQSTLFYSSVAWLPSVLQYRGLSELQAAGWVTALQLTGCLASLTIPYLAGRSRSQSPWLTACVLGILAGLLGVLYLPTSLAGPATLLLGAGLNAGFGLALLVIPLRSATPATASNLSAMAQAIGYLFAAPGPFIVGWLSTHGGWEIAFGYLILLACAALVAGHLAGRPGELPEEAPPS
ncbi:MAG: CynX/NimT family MFS transporter [Verrucomicrobiales bacterium]